jgi:hypothetical protein
MATYWELEYKQGESGAWTTLSSTIPEGTAYYDHTGALIPGETYYGRIRRVVDSSPEIWSKEFLAVYSTTVNALVADELIVGSPEFGTPALSENIATSHALAAQTLIISPPVLGAPAVAQKHALTASGLTVSAPVLGTPALVENENPVDALTANDLVVGSPVLGAPALWQIHVLGSDGLVTGSPVLGSPSITQIHALTALGLTAGVPVLGTPVINGTILDLGVTTNLRSVGLDTIYFTPFGVFSVELSSSGTQRITLRSVGNFEVNELGE